MAAEAEPDSKAGADPTGRFKVDPSPSASAITDRPIAAGLADVIIEAYEGERDAAGRLSGQGKAQFAGGHAYEGGFVDGMMSGEGTYTWADGVVYVGTFELNRVTGEGTFTWPDGSIYVGAVRGGKRHGSGRFQCGDSPVHYDGEWKDGKRHGQGTLFYDTEETCYYKGQWANDKRHGQGVAVYPSGNVYTGGWAEDVKHGQGTMEWHSRREVYTGEWRGDKPHGRGSHVWYEQRAIAGAAQKQMCNRYEGEFAEGVRSGVGVFHYSNGAMYDGEWEGNKKHGRGVFTFEDGEIYDGEFVHDRMADPRRKRDESGAAASGGSRMIHLKIDDLLQGMPLAEQRRSKQDAYNVLLRWNSDLKQIYQFYSVVGTSHVDTMFTMSTKQFWRFIKDCRLADSVLTVAAMDRIVTDMRRKHADAIREAQLRKMSVKLSPRARRAKEVELEKAARGDGSHDPHRPILFREFLEVLVRIADAKFPEGGSLHRRLQKLLTRVKKGAMKDTKDPFRRIMVSEDVRRVVETYDHLLRAVFMRYAQKDQSSHTAMQQDKSLNVREFLLLMKDCGVISESFTISDVMRIFLKANYQLEDDTEQIAGLDDDHPVDNLESEMIYAEFVEGIARVAHRQYHEGTHGSLFELEQQLGDVAADAQAPAEPTAPLELHQRLHAFVRINMAPALRKLDPSINKAAMKDISGSGTARKSSVLV